MNIPISEICRLVGLQLGIKTVNSQDHLREDLGAESLDIQNIVMAMEDKYQLQFNDDELSKLATVADFHQLIQARG